MAEASESGALLLVVAVIAFAVLLEIRTVVGMFGVVPVAVASTAVVAVAAVVYLRRRSG